MRGRALVWWVPTGILFGGVIPATLFAIGLSADSDRVAGHYDVFLWLALAAGALFVGPMLGVTALTWSVAYESLDRASAPGPYGAAGIVVALPSVVASVAPEGDALATVLLVVAAGVSVIASRGIGRGIWKRAHPGSDQRPTPAWPDMPPVSETSGPLFSIEDPAVEEA